MFRTKGLVVRGIVDFVTETFGADGHQRWFAALSPETRELLAQPILVSSWYPGERVVEMRRAICDVFYEGDVTRIRTLGRFQADRILRGVYKVFVKLGSPEWVAKRCSKLFALHFEPGTLEIVELASGLLRVRLTDFPDHTGIMENIFFGFFEVALKISGATVTRITAGKSLARGDSCSEFEVTWRLTDATP